METLYRRIMTREGYTFEPIKIDTLQRYDFDYDGYGVDEKGDWIKYDDLKKLLLQ